MTFKENGTVKEILERLIARATKQEAIIINPACTFKDLGVDSLEVVHILVALEDELGIDINDADLKNIHNMGAFVSYLEQKVSKKKPPKRK
jgi:acyl carrier protein